MEPDDYFDPMAYYTYDSLTTVDSPPLEVPAHLQIPPDLTAEPDWDCTQWLQRGMASNYPTSLFQPQLKADQIWNIWRETELIYPLLPIHTQAMKHLHQIATEGYNSKLFDIRPSMVPNVILEQRLWTPTIVVLDSWIRKGFVMGPYPAPPFLPAKVNGLLGKYCFLTIISPYK